MTKDEALKLALEALAKVDTLCPVGSSAEIYVRDALDSIKEVLAQPEVFSKQNYLSGYCVGQSELLAEQAKQEPAAWMVYTQDGKSVYITDNPTDIESNQRALPLYVTPKREWVGLTLVEVNEIEKNGDFWEDHTPFDFFFKPLKPS